MQQSTALMIMTISLISITSLSIGAIAYLYTISRFWKKNYMTENSLLNAILAKAHGISNPNHFRYQKPKQPSTPLSSEQAKNEKKAGSKGGKGVSFSYGRTDPLPK